MYCLANSFLLTALFFSIILPVPAHSSEPSRQQNTAAPVLGLEDFIAIGLENNPGITAARNAIWAAEGRQTQASSAYLPQLSASGSAAHLHITDMTPEEDNNVLTGSLAGRQLIFDFGKTTGAISASSYSTDAAVAQLNAAGGNLIYSIKAAYYNVLANFYLIQVANEQVQSYTLQYERAYEYFKAGVKSKIDVTNAQVELNNANLQLLQSQFNLKSAKVTLERTIGMKPANGNYLLGMTDHDIKDFVTLLPPLPENLAKMLEQASLQRPDLMQAQKEMASAKSAVSQAKGGYWPEIAAKGSYDTYETENEIATLNDQWQVSVGLDWQFFSGLRTNGEVAEAKSNFRTSMARVRDTELTAIQEVTDSYYRAEEKRESVFLADKIVKLAEENLELADERYKSGLGDMIEYNDAQLRMSQARTNLVTTYFDYNTALASLDRAIGIYPDMQLTEEQLKTARQ